MNFVENVSHVYSFFSWEYSSYIEIIYLLLSYNKYHVFLIVHVLKFVNEFFCYQKKLLFYSIVDKSKIDIAFHIFVWFVVHYHE